MKIKSLHLITFGLVTACSPVMTTPAIRQALQPAADPAAPVECAAECKTEWERAQVWIAKHAFNRVEKNSDVLVETRGNAGGKRYNFRALREPVANGRHRISLEADCTRCDPTPNDVQRAFYHYITTGTDLLEGVRLTGYHGIR